MKIKNLLIGTSVALFTGAALYNAYVLSKAQKFKATLNKNSGSMDEMILYGGKIKAHQNQTMQNLKVGAFYGGMQLDFSNVIAERDHYQMEVSIMNGGLNIVVPENFALNIVDTCKFGGISDSTVCATPEQPITLSVFADVTFGGLNFENPNPEQTKN
jgi:predicted membrane protein